MTKDRKSPQQKLARVIQTVTSKPYTACLEEAGKILAASPSGRCGDRLTKWTCTQRPGPHPGWRHVDDESGTWWTQSRVFPYANTSLSPGSEDVTPQTAARIPAQVLRQMNGGGREQ